MSGRWGWDEYDALKPSGDVDEPGSTKNTPGGEHAGEIRAEGSAATIVKEYQYWARANTRAPPFCSLSTVSHARRKLLKRLQSSHQVHMSKIDGELREMGLPELRSLMSDSSIEVFFNQRCSLVHERRKLLLEVRCTRPTPHQLLLGPR